MSKEQGELLKLNAGFLVETNIMESKDKRSLFLDNWLLFLLLFLLFYFKGNNVLGEGKGVCGGRPL